MKKYYLILAGILIFTSCHKSNEMAKDNILKVGEVTEIKSGETMDNAPYGLSLRVGNINDSRCPEGVICCWAGYVSVQLYLTTKTGNYDFILEPHSIIFKNDTVIEGLKYQLKDVLPYPVFGKEQSEKMVKILISAQLMPDS